MTPHLARVKRTIRRRGVLMTWLIWVIIVAVLIVGGLFNSLWVASTQAELHRSAQASALAAGHAWLSDDMLRLRQESFEIDGRAVRCRHAAIETSRRYASNAKIPVLTEQDVVLHMPTVMSVPSSTGPHAPTQIEVSFGRFGHGVRSRQFFGGLAGVPRRRVGVSASVSLECRPVAFRPGAGVTVPMLPFAILDDTTAISTTGSSTTAQTQSAGHWTSCIEYGTGQDAVSWNSETHCFDMGPDGIPELTCRLNCNGPAGDDALIPLAVAAADETQSICHCIEHGLSESGLHSLGLQQLAYPSSHLSAVVNRQQVAAVAAALARQTGKPLIVSLCSRSDSTAASTVELVRPVAVRIVRIGTGGSGELRITMQPCVLVTSTAVMSNDADAPASRYIYSVRLDK